MSTLDFVRRETKWNPQQVEWTLWRVYSKNKLSFLFLALPTGSTKAVTLPLHQRLSMIRMSQRLPSNAAALKVLAAEGQWFEARWNALLAPANNSNTAPIPEEGSKSTGDGEDDKENASSQQ